MNKNQNKNHSRGSAIFTKKMLRHVLFSAFLEFGPVLVFLISFRHMGVYASTVVLMLATMVSTIVTYRLQKRIPYLALYVASITMVFGYLTLHAHAIKFIQMRDTLYDMTCALTLIVGVIINVQFLALVFDPVVPMSTKAWGRLTYLWIGYFIITAVSNETVRRLFSVEAWFLYKGCVVVITALFGLLGLYISYEPKEDNAVVKKY